MKKYILFISIIFLFFSNIQLDAKYWEKLENLPAAARAVQWLDVYFLNSTHGWICGRSYGDYLGKVARTTDGGETWQISSVSGWFLESVHFVDTQHGICSGPEGIYKSDDGGVTWRGISYINDLVNQDIIDTWGCFMLNRDTMYVVGGGCYPADTNSIRDHRIIWRSTDRGETWTAFSLSFIPLNGHTNYYSGLTDIMVYPNGTGYASSSGLVWKTTNYGDSWFILSQTSTYLSWQEEITNYNNSILVPFSGTDCSGASFSGGMRFSNNINSSFPTWNEYNTSYPMYGSFLLGANEGWACGSHRSIYYTDNAGESWSLLNCGIEDDDDLDDIFFLNSNTAWVVGDNIYRLNNSSKMLIEKDTVDFGDSCTASVLYDTLLVKNMNFYSSTIDISVLENSPYFSIVNPVYLTYPLPACGESKIIVRYAPTAVGEHKYSIIVKLYPSDENIVHIDTIYYKGALKEFTAHSDKDTIDFGDVLIKTNAFQSLRWYSSTTDTIKSYKCSVNNIDVTSISASSKIPFTIHPDSENLMEFKISPKDTGIMYITYTFSFTPCNDIRTVVLKVNGISPIISAKDSFNIDVVCKNDTIVKIPITNTGSSNLEIYKLHLEDSTKLNPITLNRQAKIMGFAKHNMPCYLAPQETDTLLLYLYSNNVDTLTGEVLIEHNDTRRLKSTNPKKIAFTSVFKKNKLNTNVIEFNFGNICVGDSIALIETIQNIGNQTIYFSNIQYQNIKEGFLMKQIPSSVIPTKKVDFIASFVPKKVGLLSDTIDVKLLPCNDTLKIVLTGIGVENNIAIEPEEINEILNINILQKYDIKLTSNSIQKIQITSAVIEPEMKHVTLTLLNKFPMYLNPGSSELISFTAIADTEITYKGRLVLYLKSECSDTLIVPINIEFVDNNIEYTDTKGNAVKNIKHYSTCINPTIYDTIYVSNTRSYTFVSLKFSDNSSKYSIVQCPVLPLKVKAEDTIEIITSNIMGSEGIAKNALVFEMQNDATNEITYDTIYLQHEFRKTDINISDTNIVFGIFEICDENNIQQIEFINKGTLDDTLYINTSSIPEYYEVDKNIIVLPANSKEVLTITFIPSKVNNVPNYDTTKFTINNTICPKQFEITLYSIVDSINIAVNPKIIDFGEVWKNHTASREIEIQNNSLFDIYLMQFDFTPNLYFTTNVQLPLLIQKNKTAIIPISFSGPETDTYNCTINMTVERSCKFSDLIELTAIVPVEKYVMQINFDTTKGMLGRPAVISAFVKDSISSEANPHGIEFSIDMNNYLFYPEKLYIIHNNTREELKFDFNFVDGISAKIDENAAKEILTKENKFLEIHGIPLLYSPRKTNIYFKEFNIITDKIYEVLQDEGSFELETYCGDNVTSRISKINNIEANFDNIVYNNTLTIKFEAEKDCIANIELFSMSGEKVLLKQLSIQKGTNDINLSTTNLSSGSYNIKITNEQGIIKSGNIIVIK